MPKRKRSVEEEVDQSFEKHSKDLFRALKAAKGFERQRLAKRSKDQKLGQETLRRLDHEVLVLKSLDLHQAAHAHLCSSLLKVKAAAQSPHLPERLRNGVPKPEISDEERTALHNVTSALYKRNQVRAVVNKAVPDLCALLGVPAPGSEPRKKKEGASSKQAPKEEEIPVIKKDASKQKEAKSPKRKDVVESESDSSDSPCERDGADDSDSPADGELDEAAISRMEAMLGGSSSEGEGEGDEEEDDNARLAKLKSRARNLDDDISLPGSDSVPEDEDEDEPESESGSSASDSDASSSAAVPPPRKKDKASKPEPAAAAKTPPKDGNNKTTTKTARPTNSTFLPSLMGGYVSGSESASDVDVAPPVRRNRRGQKARQAIWEKKYGEGAKHLAKSGDRKRDAGWDAKRGAVDPAADGKPWKRGVRNPLLQKSAGKAGGGGGGGGDQQKETQPKNHKKVETKKKRDDDGPLHPSWLAKKKAKQAQEGVKFEGKKIVFD